MKGKSAAFSDFGTDGHLASVQQGQMLNDREPQTRATHVSRPRSIDPVKALKETLEMLRRNSIAVVMHEDLVARAAFVRDGDSAILPTELDAVVDQVREDLLEATHICKNNRISRYVVLQRDVLRRGFRRKRRANVLN